MQQTTDPKLGGARKARPGSDIEIARAAAIKPIMEIGASLGIDADSLIPYGHYKAKVDLNFIRGLQDRPDGKLILMTGITPTPAGEGKTTTSVGLTDALNRIDRKAAVCLREPSLGPCFGMKGGAAGGGYAQVIPMEDINLHFTGDIHAIGVANNLLAAMIDNHLNWGNELDIDPRRIHWRRVMDMNERALRHIVNGIGRGNGIAREDGFDITVASEVMAILCLSSDLQDLQARLGRIVVAETRDGKPVTAADLGADGAMTVLLKDALMPNLVQTLENNPAFVHGGPFANIAHGCNSLMATRTALKLSDYVVTEAGFGADLGAEKFFDIKCRKAGLKPSAAVIVATVRALKMHGGVALKDLGEENVEALQAGCENLVRHVQNVRSFGIPAVVAINRFGTDTDAEIRAIQEILSRYDTTAVTCSHWADGGAGSEMLARKVVELVEGGESGFHPLYEDDMPLWDKVRTVATKLYGAADISADKRVVKRFEELQNAGYGNLPVCMAKTQYSFSTDPSRKGAPSGHTVEIRDVRLSAGAGFVVVACGDIMTMPGLPRNPAANSITISESGEIVGLT